MTRPRDIADSINRINSSAADATAVTIDSSERVGIGTTSPAEMLHVYHATANINAIIESGDANAYLAFKDNSTTGYAHVFLGASGNDMTFFSGGSSEQMRLNSSGNVGIGTTSITSSAGWTPRMVLAETSGSPAVILKGDNSQEGSVGASNGLYIDCFGSTTGTNNNIIFRNTPSNSNFVAQERMRIDSSGNVGIGTTSPSQKLDIATSSGAAYITQTNGTATTFLGPDSANTGLFGTSTNHATRFMTNNTERMRISSAGGIGGQTTSPRSDIVFTSGTQVSSKRWGFGGPFGSVGSNDVFYIINEGNVGQYMAHGGQSWIAHSDERIKENITNVGEVLPSLLNMRCVKYNLISNPEDTKIGFIAQDWETSFPELIDENAHLVLEDNGTIGIDDDSDSETPVKAMSYTETIPLLLKAIQEQQVIINDLKARIEALENA